MECDVLKMRKRAWTNDDLTSIRSPTGGIFFSIWVTEKGGQEGRAEYNIHSYGLQKLKAYRIKGRDFCEEFRGRFETMRKAWPNVSTKYGCTTLMEGWFAMDKKSFARDALAMMDQFEGVAGIIDELLEKRVRVSGRGRQAEAGA
jgi:hypothetical protein